MKQPNDPLQLPKPTRNIRKIAKKVRLICHVAKVKPATSAHSMADVIPIFSASNPTLKEKYFIHSKENIIRNIFRTLMF